MANVARRASQPVRAGTAGFSQVVWDVKRLLSNASKELDPALYLVATPLGVIPICCMHQIPLSSSPGRAGYPTEDDRAGTLTCHSRTTTS